MAAADDRPAVPHPAAPVAAMAAAPASDRERMRALRAERLARLRSEMRSPVGPTPEAPSSVSVSVSAAAAVRAPARGLPDAAAIPVPVRPAAGDDGALSDFIHALVEAAGEGAPAPLALDPPAPAPQPAAVLHFHRPGAAPAPAASAAEAAAGPGSDLDRLPGVGPGLAWALARAGLARRADIAGLEAAELAARLGPIGRLVPAAAWIAAARAASPQAR